MGNRPHPFRREDQVAMDREDAECYDADTEHVAAAGRQAWRGDAAAFEAECDRAFLEGSALEAAEKAARIREYETSPEQADWEADEIEPLDHFERPWG
jgi:hypothetical protein